jgi:hypothetical protein
MTKKIDLDKDWGFRNQLAKIVEKNCEKIPYEGTTVDKEGIVNDIIEFLNTNHYSVLHHIKNNPT